jgi:hypothetical protein
MFTTGKIKSVYIFCVLATMLIAQDSSGKSGTTQKSLQQPAQKRNLENADDFNAVGDWRSISRPGYRAQPTPQSVEFYKYIMKKWGDGEEVTWAERLVISRMIKNRTWPEAPTVRERDKALDKWLEERADDSDPNMFLDPEGWSRKQAHKLAKDGLHEAGLGDRDREPNENVQKFREYWHAKTQEEKDELPVGKWMNDYLIGKGFDMRTDEERAYDEAWHTERDEKARAEEEEREAERREAEERIAKEQQDWFDEMRKRDDEMQARREAIARLEEAVQQSKEDGFSSEEGMEAGDGGEFAEQQEVPGSEDAEQPELPDVFAGTEPEESAERDTGDVAGTEDNEGSDVQPEEQKIAQDDTQEESTPEEQPEKFAEKEPDDVPSRKTKDEKEEDYGEKGQVAMSDDQPDESYGFEAESAQEQDSHGEKTTTQGYVQGSDGTRTTISETRDADGNLVSITETTTDASGNVVSQTVYAGGTGEGKTTMGGDDLRGAEAGSDVEVGLGVSSGYNTAEIFISQWESEQGQKGQLGSATMGHNARMSESANSGDQQMRDAQTIRDFGGRDARDIQAASARETAGAAREQSWGRVIGDAIESGIAEGGAAFGEEFGHGAANRAIYEIYDGRKERRAKKREALTAQDKTPTRIVPGDSGCDGECTVPEATPGKGGGEHKKSPPPAEPSECGPLILTGWSS